MSFEVGVRQKLGVLWYDLPLYLRAFAPRWSGGRPGAWVRVRNRGERLLVAPDGTGVACDWQWTSRLHAVEVFPGLGRALLRAALANHPVVMNRERQQGRSGAGISFIIGHRGQGRIPHLLATIASIGAQVDVRVECIVVEHSAEPETQGQLPSWVRYLHCPLADDAQHYCRGLPFNLGARHAKGDLIVLHDGDLLVPRDYASRLLTKYGQGYRVINLKRFIFYLSDGHTRRIFETGRLTTDLEPVSVMQNAEGCGSIAIEKKAYRDIGGFDEDFVGWGGEDNEFWQRAQTLSVWPYGFLPFVHLWHEDQPEKYQEGRVSARLLLEKSVVPPTTRIVELALKNFGTAGAE